MVEPGARVEWTQRGPFGVFRERGRVMSIQKGRATIRRDDGGVTLRSVSKLRPLTAHDLALEAWTARRPIGRQHATADPDLNDPGDITLSVPFRRIEAVTVADLDAILADVTAIREWLASRPAP